MYGMYEHQAIGAGNHTCDEQPQYGGQFESLEKINDNYGKAKNNYNVL